MRRVRTKENIATVSASVNQDCNLSINRRSQQLGLCYSTTWKIVRKDLGLRLYKIQLVQELNPNDLSQRRIFDKWALEKLKEDRLFYRKIVFSDEVHFWLNGYVNKQNCHIWCDEQPYVIQELRKHPEKCTVWCCLWSGGVIGPYFFKDYREHNVTVNGARYRSIISNYFWHKMHELNLVDMWFQQSGATCHTARELMDHQLRNEFSKQFISRFGPMNCPARSCDLT